MQLDVYPTLMGYNNAGGWPLGNGTAGNNGAFSFRKRQERIDWRKIASIDLDRISRELDFDTLQDNIANVAFCNIECELDPRCSDPNYVKLFRLAQLIIEYLLHSQDYLSHTVVALEEKCRYLTSEFDKMKKQNGDNESTIKSLKDEVKKYKKMICLQQNAAAPSECHPCPFCSKMFVTPEYVQMHVKRRHLDSCPPQPEAAAGSLPPQMSCVVEKLEKELTQLKERLQQTEFQLQEERKAKCDEDFLRQIQVWKVQQLEGQKKEIESIRDLFMKEMQELNERTSFAEHCVTNLQRELKDVCNCSPSPPPSATQPPNCSAKEENSDLLKGQKKEFCKLRKHLTDHVEDAVCRRLKEQEDCLQKKIKCLVKEQNVELEKLNCLVQEKFCKPEVVQNDCLIQNLCERTKEQERQLKKQKRKIDALMYSQPLPGPSPANVPSCPEPDKKYSLKPRDDIYVNKPRKDSDSNSMDSQQHHAYLRNRRLTEALSKNHSLVQDLRDELSCMLREKLQNVGSAQLTIKGSLLGELANKKSELNKGKVPLDQSEVQNTVDHLVDKYADRLHRQSERERDHETKGSKSWSDSYNLDQSDEEINTVRKRNEEHVEVNRKKVLERSPSLPLQEVSSQQSAGEWKEKIEKPSRLINTKASFQKLMTSMKKRLKPRKFWQPTTSHSSPNVTEAIALIRKPTEEKKKEPVTAALQMSVDETEEEEEEESEEDESDEDETDDEEDETIKRTVNVKETLQLSPMKRLSKSEPNRMNLSSKSLTDGSKVVDTSSDWESPSELEEVKEYEKPEEAATTSRLFTVLPQKAPRSSIEQRTHDIEAKLSGQRAQPFGGVDAISGTKIVTPTSRNDAIKKQVPKFVMSPSSDFDDEESESEVARVVGSGQESGNLNAREGHGHIKNSWVSNPSNLKVIGGVKPRGVTDANLPASKWDSDDGISEIT